MNIAHFDLENMNVEDGNLKIADELNYLINTEETDRLYDELATLDPEDEDYLETSLDIIQDLESLAYDHGYLAGADSGTYYIEKVED